MSTEAVPGWAFVGCSQVADGEGSAPPAANRGGVKCGFRSKFEWAESRDEQEKA